ncbi:hypothetical protein BDN70DRAFT_884367, partial [Pholiota conissans]
NRARVSSTYPSKWPFWFVQCFNAPRKFLQSVILQVCSFLLSVALIHIHNASSLRSRCTLPTTRTAATRKALTAPSRVRDFLVSMDLIGKVFDNLDSLGSFDGAIFPCPA